MEKQYIEFLYPRIFVLESEIKEIGNREDLIFKINPPKKGCSAYRFFARQESKTKDGEILLGEPKNYSATYYFEENETTNLDILIPRLEYNGCRVVFNKNGKLSAFIDKDKIVSEQ